jgi:hypothetical protein
MTDQDKEYLRDLLAGFAMCGLLMRSTSNNLELIAPCAYSLADDMLEARKQKETVGLPAIKKRVKK